MVSLSKTSPRVDRQVDLDPTFDNLGGGFEHFLFSPLLGEMIQIIKLTNIFQMG